MHNLPTGTTFSVVDNRYMGEGFAWVIPNLPRSERWKYNFHGEYFDHTTADAKAAELNAAWDEA